MMILKNLVQKSISTPFKKTHPCTILPPPFYNLLNPPLRRRQIKSPPPKLCEISNDLTQKTRNSQEDTVGGVFLNKIQD